MSLGRTHRGTAGFNSAVVSDSELLYDVITIAKNGDIYPITPSARGVAEAGRHGRHVWDTWDANYSKCSVKLKVGGSFYTFTNTYIGGPFANKTDLFIWINNNLPNSAGFVIGHAKIEIFDYISSEIPSISKVYGYNYLFCSLAGRGLHKSGSVKTGIEGSSVWLDIFEDLTDNWRQEGILPHTVTSAMLTSDSVNNLKLFWLPANKRNLYGLPKINGQISLSDIIPSDYRKWWNFNTDISRNQVIGDAYQHNLVALTYIIGYNDTSYEINNNPKDRFYTDNNAICCAYLVQHANNTDDYAIYIKPNGISSIIVDWFDLDTYRLEVIAFNKDKQYWIKPINILKSQEDQDFYGNRSMVNKSWLIMDNLHAQKNAGFVTPRSYKFRLRNLSTNKIGSLSKGCIKPVLNKTGSQMKWIVSN